MRGGQVKAVNPRTFTLPAAQVRPADFNQGNWQAGVPYKKKKPQKATAIRIGNATTKSTYNGAEVCMPALRTGADDALQVPSRINDRLYFRDGRVTDLHGQPLQPHHE